MDLESLKNIIGLEDEDEDYDTQIQAAIDFFADKDYDVENMFYAIMCFLQRVAPELVAQVTNYRVGDISESFKIPEGSTFCDLYQKYVEGLSRGVAIASGSRSGHETQGFETVS